MAPRPRSVPPADPGVVNAQLAPTTGTPAVPKGGRFTGADLAKIVKPDSALTALGGTPAAGPQLDDVAAQDILLKRLLALKAKPHITIGQQAITADEGDMAEIIVDAIPQELRTAPIMAAIDLRPYLQALDQKPILHRENSSILGFGVGSNATWNAPPTRAYVDAESERIYGDAIVAAGGTKPVTNTAFTPGVATAVAPVMDATATAAAGVTTYDANGNPIAPGAVTGGVAYDAQGNVIIPTAGTTGEPTSTARFPIEGLRVALQEGTAQLLDIANQESLAQDPSNANTTGYYPGQFFPVQVVNPQMFPKTAQEQVWQVGPEAGTISAGDALRYLQTLKPDEVHNMQLKLAAAGYFDRLNNGGGYLDGDALDTNTQAAWNQLLTDSMKKNRSIPAVLGSAMTTYRDQVRKERLGMLSKIDPTYVNTLANDYAQSVIGHDLTPDQLDSLKWHLTGLVSERAGYVAGAPDNNRLAGPLPNADQGFTQQDIQLGMNATPGFKDEQRHQNDLALEYKLRALMK